MSLVVTEGCIHFPPCLLWAWRLLTVHGVNFLRGAAAMTVARAASSSFEKVTLRGSRETCFLLSHACCAAKLVPLYVIHGTLAHLTQR